MPYRDLATGNIIASRREIIASGTGLTLASLLLAACGQSAAPAKNPSTARTSSPTVTRAESQNQSLVEQTLLARGFQVSSTPPAELGAGSATEQDRQNVVSIIFRVLTLVPEITDHYDPQQQVGVYAVNSYLGGPKSGIIGFTDSGFTQTIDTLNNRRARPRRIVLASQNVISMIKRDNPNVPTFQDLSPAQLQQGAMVNELFNYLQGSTDITRYLQGNRSADILTYHFDPNTQVAYSIGGSILIYEKNNGKLVVEFSGPEQFFGDLLQTYVAQRLAAGGDQAAAIFDEKLAEFAAASGSRFGQIAGSFQKLRQVLKSETGKDLAVQLAKAKSSGNIGELFSAVKPHLSDQEFLALQKYLLNSNLNQQ